jgi:hypothetical protein
MRGTGTPMPPIDPLIYRFSGLGPRIHILHRCDAETWMGGTPAIAVERLCVS